MYGESIDGSYKNYISVAPIGLERVSTKHKVVGSNPTRDTTFSKEDFIMGIRLFQSSSFGRSQTNDYLPNDPRPNDFEIRVLEQYGNNVLGLVYYPHATNFEGEKILVWQDSTTNQIKRMSVIDPHFLEDNKIIARFRPTVEGVELARNFCKVLMLS